MKRKTGSILILLGLALILGAGALTAYNFWDEDRAAESSAKALKQLIERIPETVPAVQTTRNAAVTELSVTEVIYPDYVLNPGMDMPVQEIDGYQYIGVLSVPSVDMELPVIDQWSYSGAAVAPCRYSGSAYLDNMVIAAHNHWGHFGPLLNNIRLDDTVIFMDVDGNVFEYRVVEFEVLKPTQIDEMITGDWDLTLFTCSIGMQTRMAVRCEKVE